MLFIRQFNVFIKLHTLYEIFLFSCHILLAHLELNLASVFIRVCSFGPIPE